MIKRLYYKQVDATGIGLFRIVFGLLQIIFNVQLFYFRQIIVDPIPWIELGEINITYGLILLLIANVFFTIGLYTRYATVISWILNVALISAFSSFHYHYDYVVISLNFMMMFMPGINNRFSIDSILQKIKNGKAQNTTVPLLYYTTIIFASLGAIYLFSMPDKIQSWMWINGLGFWLPASLPCNTIVNYSFILNSKFISLSLGYITVVFELVFLFLFWHRAFRIPLLVVGLGLHLGIALVFPIPAFGFSEAIIYILMVPFSFWRWLSKKIKAKSPSLIVFYDKHCRLCQRTKIIVESFDVLGRIQFLNAQDYVKDFPSLKQVELSNILKDIHAVSTRNNNQIYKGIDTYIQICFQMLYTWPLGLIMKIPGIYTIGEKVYSFVSINRVRCEDGTCKMKDADFIMEVEKEQGFLKNVSIDQIKIWGVQFFIVFYLVSCLLFLSNSLAVKKIMGNIGQEASLNHFNARAQTTKIFITKFFGIHSHTVFMYESHFLHYNHLIGLTYLDKTSGKEVWLPLQKENGLVGIYNFDRFWLKWFWRSIGPNINNQKLDVAFKKFSAFWAHKNNVNLNNAEFFVKVKYIDDVTGWEKDFLNKQLQKP